jgi:competence protein ComEC
LDFPDGPALNDPLGSAYRKASKGKRSRLSAGDTIPLRGDVSAVVLTSGGKVIDPSKAIAPSGSSLANTLCAEAPADKPEDSSDNARSLTIRFRLGKFDFLDCGDLTWNVEKALVCPQNLIGTIDLFQVTHHGMDISNHPTLLRTIQPTVAIMDNGPLKGGAPATVRLLKSIPSIKASYQLHKNAKTGAEDNTEAGLIANADPAGGQFIKVSVTGDGSKYSVQIGPDGSKREFTSN